MPSRPPKVKPKVPASSPRRAGRPRAVPRRLKRAAADDILAHAARLFSRKGFAATTTREIAHAAGVRQPSLFYHYPTKDALLAALCRVAYEEPRAFAEQVMREKRPASQRLHDLIFRFARHLRTAPYDLRVLGMCPELLDPKFRELWVMRRRIMEVIRDLIAEGVRSGEFVRVDPSHASIAVTTMTEGSVDYFTRPGARDSEEFARGLADFALRGLLKRNPAP